MTPSQCRAARALLLISQTELAEAAGLSLSTVVDFERVRRPVSDKANGRIRTALVDRGITFIDRNGGGRGVRFTDPET